MSHFYGSIPVSARKTVPTACAHKRTGLTVRAAARGGAIEVTLYVNKLGQDCYRVYERPVGDPPHNVKGYHRVLCEGIFKG